MKTNDRQLSPAPDDPDLHELSGWEDTAAAVTLTAPRRRAPAHCLTEIKSRVARDSCAPVSMAVAGSARRVNGHTHTSKKRPAWLGYGLAATLAIFGGWQSVRVVRLNNEITTLKSTISRTPDSTANTPGPGSAAVADKNSTDPFSPSHKRPGPQSRAFAAESIVVPDRAALQRKLDEIQRLHAAHFQPAPGLARTVVMELQAPGAKPTTPIRTSTLSAEVADYIVAGIDKNRPGDKPALTISGNDKNRSGDDLVIEKGMPNLSAIQLQPDTAILHKDFPIDSWQQWEGLHLLNDGRFYDEVNNIIWKPLPGEGRRYSGRTAEEVIDLSTQSAPRDSVVPENSAAPMNDVPAGQPLAYSIYDESRGEGRLVVSDLPPAPEGKAYQLWFEDVRSSTPVTAGLLPPLENGTGQVWFDLTPGISPMNYRITVEPAGGSAAPQGPVILSGP